MSDHSVDWCRYFSRAELVWWGCQDDWPHSDLARVVLYVIAAFLDSVDDDHIDASAFRVFSFLVPMYQEAPQLFRQSMYFTLPDVESCIRRMESTLLFSSPSPDGFYHRFSLNYDFLIPKACDFLTGHYNDGDEWLLSLVV